MVEPLDSITEDSGMFSVFDASYLWSSGGVSGASMSPYHISIRGGYVFNNLVFMGGIGIRSSREIFEEWR